MMRMMKKKGRILVVGEGDLIRSEGREERFLERKWRNRRTTMDLSSTRTTRRLRVEEHEEETRATRWSLSKRNWIEMPNDEKRKRSDGNLDGRNRLLSRYRYPREGWLSSRMRMRSDLRICDVNNTLLRCFISAQGGWEIS